ncbi:hypothetical protein HK099_001027 [Clydaea vesicula]|uniref:Uncharacterized protein n=1 Tax=Clydaea vesicula TaxID=447962 RepID=A0AAD5TUF5_9FUNG|nr:hypothetical protein HK099_001027 [Clydaea vesicula]
MKNEQVKFENNDGTKSVAAAMTKHELQNDDELTILGQCEIKKKNEFRKNDEIKQTYQIDFISTDDTEVCRTEAVDFTRLHTRFYTNICKYPVIYPDEKKKNFWLAWYTKDLRTCYKNSLRNFLRMDSFNLAKVPGAPTDAYPLPSIRKSVERLGKATIFTALDATSGFDQLQSSKKDQEKTAFSTR